MNAAIFELLPTYLIFALQTILVRADKFTFPIKTIRCMFRMQLDLSACSNLAACNGLSAARIRICLKAYCAGLFNSQVDIVKGELVSYFEVLLYIDYGSATPMTSRALLYVQSLRPCHQDTTLLRQHYEKEQSTPVGGFGRPRIHLGVPFSTMHKQGSQQLSKLHPTFANCACFVRTWAHDAAPEGFPRARAFPEALQ